MSRGILLFAFILTLGVGHAVMATAETGARETDQQNTYDRQNTHDQKAGQEPGMRATNPEAVGDPHQRDSLPPVGARGASDGSTEVVVKEGDTLAKLAKSHLGTADRWREIARANDIDDPDELEVGKKIKIPARDSDRSKSGTNDEKRKRDTQSGPDDRDMQRERGTTSDSDPSGAADQESPRPNSRYQDRVGDRDRVND